MIIFFLVIAKEVLKCVSFRWCETVSGVELVRLWELGSVEIMFEGVLGGVAIKLYRRVADKFPKRQDRTDKIIEED